MLVGLSEPSILFRNAGVMFLSPRQTCRPALRGVESAPACARPLLTLPPAPSVAAKLEGERASQGCGRRDQRLARRRECEPAQLLGHLPAAPETTEQSPRDPATPLLGVCPGETEAPVRTNTRAASFTKRGNGPSAPGWVMDEPGSPSVQWNTYPSATKTEEILTQASAWTGLKDVVCTHGSCA